MKIVDDSEITQINIDSEPTYLYILIIISLYLGVVRHCDLKNKTQSHKNIQKKSNKLMNYNLQSPFLHSVEFMFLVNMSKILNIH